MVTIRLNGIEAAALDVVARHRGITPDHLIRDLIRDAAICLVTGKPSHVPSDVAILKADNNPKRSEG